MQKRWRVDYGLVQDRHPPTRLAVPYRAKDSPSPRSEFSHPDVVILLTSLSYYYGGLSDADIFLAFERLTGSDQADVEYQAWVRDADSLPESFRQLCGINLEDTFQCTNEVFPRLRRAKGVIDYFLSHIVFTKEMREFPHKLSASGWDIGETKINCTTGFSGTNESRVVLPLTVEQLDLPEQTHTNALVLDYLLRPENSVISLDSGNGDNSELSNADKLLSVVVSMDPPVRVILDVGAQNLELTNIELAKKWLAMLTDSARTKAAIFFDETDHICVIDRQGKVEMLDTSPYAGQMDACLVFLDEVHTRGTDLKLPQDYRAAVTLGAHLTKDKLVQACMRMRELGKGQSVVFCVPHEIGLKVQACSGRNSTSNMTVANILHWSITETWREAGRSIPLWATQGKRHRENQQVWNQARQDGTLNLTEDIANRLLEDEAQSLQQRYKPGQVSPFAQSSTDNDIDMDDPIAQRCRDFGFLDHRAARLREEQERELSPEIERERQIERPPPAKPAEHKIHPDVENFIATGMVVEGSPAFIPAFASLAETSAAAYIDLSKYPGRLLVTADFSRCVRGDSPTQTSKLDCFQRSVQWILTGTHRTPEDVIQHMVVISPFEAQELLPSIATSEHVVLHLYAPRPNLGYRPLDGLDLFTIPDRRTSRIPDRLIIELNLFAGQLYFNSLGESISVRNFLGLAGQSEGEAYFGDNAAKFFKTLLTRVRRNCESVDKTHLGMVLNDRVLTEEDFKEV